MKTVGSVRMVAVLLLALALQACSHGKPATAVATKPQTDLEKRLDEVLKRGKTGSTFYVARVVDLKTGEELYAVDPDKPVMPASNGKICVGAATLDFFGADATFKTYLAMNGDDLWIIGTGDPGIGDAMTAKKYGGTTMTVLDQWADALRAKGVTHISGNLYYYDRAFDDEWVCPSWSSDYSTEWYAAPISGLNFNNNCVDISVKPTEEGQPVAYKVVPPTQGVKVINKCITKPGHGEKDEPDVTRLEKENTFTITGATTKPVDIKGEAVTDPGAFFADALRTNLATKGITIDGQTKRADKPLGTQLEPPKDKIIATHESKIADCLDRINKQSQNNFADGFCKLLSRGYAENQGKNTPGSFSGGQEAVKAFLKKNDIDGSKLVVVDGSGLSRQDRVTARIISSVFVTMDTHPAKKTYFDSLSISGTDGTIKSRMDDLKGRVHAKTGYIGGVRSLSGYVQNDDGHWIVFSFIFNGIQGSVKPIEELQDNACRVLAAWPKAAKLPTSKPATKPATTTASN